MPLPQIVLASSSPYRKTQLAKLQLPFVTARPDLDETPLPNESVSDMVNRLTLAKAKAVADDFPEAIIIASDQSASFNNRPVGKPHSYDKAVKQLQAFSGNTVTFLTGLVVLTPHDHRALQTLDKTFVTFRDLSDSDIHNYLTLEAPYDCAGSFKSEGLGVTLFESIDSKDPNALIGLPMIALCHALRESGVPLPYLETA